MQYGLKVVYPGWRTDALREERIAFPESAANLMKRIEPGTKFLVYVTGCGVVGAGETTGTFRDGMAKYGWGPGPFPLSLPCLLVASVPQGAEFRLSEITRRRFYLVGRTWIDFERDEFERGRDKVCLASERPAA